MQYQSSATNQDIVSAVKWWAGLPSTDSTSYPIADITRNCNAGLARVESLIFRSDKRWRWDDSNQSDIPIYTQNLVSGQRDYALAVTHLKINRVAVIDSAGNHVTLRKVNREDLSDGDLDEPAGLPRVYVPLGKSVLLYPAPLTGLVTLTNGLEVQLQRSFSYFATTDTTKIPGIDDQFHILIALYAARDYCAANELLNRMNRIDAEILRWEDEVKKYYEGRGAENTEMGVQGIRFR